MSWENFKKQFPGADFSQFKEADGDIIFKPTGEVLYRKGDLQPKAVWDIIKVPINSGQSMNYLKIYFFLYDFSRKKN